ncbi:major facilitator superfamily domain-containing protein [Butyriboletus roseoflavus]|nr:major facilitator superfamily domain-containing protein [Butyriboletus roseoflavus]
MLHCITHSPGSSSTVMKPSTKSSNYSAEGTLYVSKLFRSKSAKRLRALITFKPRKSHFDMTNESSGSNEFRVGTSLGFFTLFWMSLFLFTVQTFVSSLEVNGYALSFAFATMFSRDVVVLALSDAILVLTTAICVPFAKAISKGWIKYYWVVQHVIQTFVLVAVITWIYHRQWPWVQSGFLTLHSLVMIMKMHSYISVNGYLHDISQRSQRILAHLRSLAEDASIGGWDKAFLDAKAHLASNSSEPHSDAEWDSQINTRGTEVMIMSSIPDPQPLRRRLVTAANDAVAKLAHEFLELDAELVSAGTERLRYPQNLTWKHFCTYMMIPTLVYELEYPRTDRIRPEYVFEKTVAFMGSFALLYTVTESFIMPLTPSPDQSFLRSLLDLALPFMIAYLLLFYIIFECICNAFAEISYFADRQFYEDWWNSTTWDEFSRKWNKPVHQFLLRHVYASSLAAYPSLSRTGAMFVTFLLSAAVHELVMVVVTRKFRLYLFFMQLVQIPLIMVSRAPVLKQNRLMGNVVFWLGLYAGFPLLKPQHLLPAMADVAEATVQDELAPLLPTKPSKKARTPLPTIQLAILLLIQFAEPISSMSIYPYINQLVGELDITGGDKRKVGYYAGLIESLFFVTQSMAVMLWSRLSDRIGRKPVILIGLSGLCISMTCFGLSTTFWQLAISRCICGLLNGNVGATKSMIGELTDSTNIARGFALMPIGWCVGSTLGPFIGGAFARPADRFPGFFTSPFWENYPYFLPCAVAASVVAVTTIILFFFLEETLAAKRKNRRSSVGVIEPDPERSIPNITLPPIPLRELFVPSIIYPVACYAVLGYLDISAKSLLPLFFSTPITYGGLSLSPSCIGACLGLLGLMDGIFQLLFLAKLVDWMGPKRLFCRAILCYIPLILLFPIMSWIVQTRGVVDTWIYACIAAQLVLIVFWDVAFACVFMFITASAPSKNTLGSINGMGQTSASIARAIGPAMATSMYAFSKQHHIFGGQATFICLILLAVVFIWFIPSGLPDEFHVRDE